MGARYAEIERSLPVPFGYGAVEHCDGVRSDVDDEIVDEEGVMVDLLRVLYR
jgi:hypothetical protein